MFDYWPLTDRFSVLRQEMDRVFDEFGSSFGFGPWATSGMYPPLNVWDAGDAMGVEAEIPGVQKDDLEILAIGNELTIKGQRKPIEGREAAYHRQERTTGEFSRSVSLPCDVVTDKVEATLENGILTLRLLKAESAKPRQIAVQAE